MFYIFTSYEMIEDIDEKGFYGEIVLVVLHKSKKIKIYIYKYNVQCLSFCYWVKGQQSTNQTTTLSKTDQIGADHEAASKIQG